MTTIEQRETATGTVGAINRARRGVGNGGAGPRPGRGRKRARRGGFTLLALAIPSIILVVLLTAYPLVYAAFQSLHNGTLISDGPYVGFKNYANQLSSSAFWQAAGFTLLFTVVGVFGSWIIGLIFALVLRSKLPASSVFKLLLLLPWVVPVVVSATAWNWLVATPQSPVPVLAHALGFGDPLFLADPTLAIILVCMFKVWISFPFMMMMSSSALAAVDHNVYEAALMDGANRWQTFRQISLPIIARSTYISWILMTIFCVNDFPTIFLLTGGGPANATMSLVVMAYTTTFQSFQPGPGVAIAFMMTLVLVVISTILYRQIRKVEID